MYNSLDGSRTHTVKLVKMQKRAARIITGCWPCDITGCWCNVRCLCDVTLSVYPHRAGLKNMPARCGYTLRVTSRKQHLLSVVSNEMSKISSLNTSLILRSGTSFLSLVPRWYTDVIFRSSSNVNMVPYDLSKLPKVFKTVINLVCVYVWHVSTWNIKHDWTDYGTTFYVNQQDFVSDIAVPLRTIVMLFFVNSENHEC
jgi:hypothetical protein